MRHLVLEKLKNRAISSNAQLYSKPTSISINKNIKKLKLVSRLRRLGYSLTKSKDLMPGQFRITPAKIDISLNGFFIANKIKQAKKKISLILNSEKDIRTIIDHRNKKKLSYFWLEPEYLSSLGNSETRKSSSREYHEFGNKIIKSVLAIEDERFYSHIGIDIKAIARAFLANIKAKRLVQGGSTITQQLAKNLLFSSKRTLLRKILEIPAATFIETSFSKEKILEFYMNEIFLTQEGRTAIHGFPAAAKTFLNKDISEVTWSEAALLAGIIKAPSALSPRRHYNKALKRRNVVLSQLKKLEVIDNATYDKALSEKPKILNPKQSLRNIPFFTDYLRKKLPTDIDSRALEKGKIRIHTGIDSEYQICAEKAVKEGLEEIENYYPNLKKKKEKAQVALVAIEPSSSSVLAWVGGREYKKSQFDHVSLAKRQPGSTFKPFVYLTALDSNLNNYKVAKSTSILLDNPVKFRVPGTGIWSPQNYDKKFRGEVSVREALTKSLNVPTVNLAKKVGITKIARTAELFGFGKNLPKVPSLALGAGEVSPFELATAYNALANGGRLSNLKTFLYITANNSIEYEFKFEETQVASEPAVYVLTDILEDVVDKGTAKIIRRKGVTMPLAAKTGTSNDGKDSWLAGYGPNILAVAWVGYDSGKAINLTGSSGAGRIWSRFLKCVEPMQENLDFVAPSGVIRTKIQKSTGYIDDGYCKEEDLISEVFVKGTEPRLLANCSRTKAGSRTRRPQKRLPSAYEIIGDIIRRIWK